MPTPLFTKGNTFGKGREPGSRRKLSEDFVSDLHELWKQQGKELLLRVAADKPEAIVNAAAKLIPKEMNVTHKFEAVRDLPESELNARIDALLGSRLPGADGPAGVVTPFNGAGAPAEDEKVVLVLSRDGSAAA